MTYESRCPIPPQELNLLILYVRGSSHLSEENTLLVLRLALQKCAATNAKAESKNAAGIVADATEVAKIVPLEVPAKLSEPAYAKAGEHAFVFLLKWARFETCFSALLIISFHSTSDDSTYVMALVGVVEKWKREGKEAKRAKGAKDGKGVKGAKGGKDGAERNGKMGGWNALLDEVLSCPRNDVFLLPALRSLPLHETMELLQVSSQSTHTDKYHASSKQSDQKLLEAVQQAEPATVPPFLSLNTS